MVLSEFNKEDRETLLSSEDNLSEWLRLILLEEGTYFKNYLRSR